MIVETTAASTIGEKVRVILLRRVICLFTLALLASTWKLWIPHPSFPQIPLLGILVDVPAFVDWIFFVLLVLALAAAGLSRASLALTNALLYSIVGLMVCLLLLNQHRIQPWAYLMVLVCLTIASCTSRQTLIWLRALFVSLYVFSAVSKFDYLFLTTLGQQFLAVGFDGIGISIQDWSIRSKVGLALTLPIGELLTAGLLCLPKTRRLGVIGALILHVALLLILGPFGMQQKIGVIIWNLQFCVLIPILFWPERTVDVKASPPSAGEVFAGGAGSVFARIVLAAAMVMPLFEPFGYWDAWPSWGLYSTRPARVEVYIQDELADRLPAPLQTHLSKNLYQGYLRKFYIDRWSLEELDAPIYPHDRFGAGVTLAILDQLGWSRGVMVVHSSPPSRRTGMREQQRIVDLKEIQKLARNYRVNSIYRRGFLLTLDSEPSHATESNDAILPGDNGPRQ